MNDQSINLLLNLEQDRQSLCRLLADLMLKKQFYLATAESCTGGLIAAACTDLAGSSQWFDRGFVTYSNAAKTDMLGVDAALIAQFGAVSEQVAAAMAQGAIETFRSASFSGCDRCCWARRAAVLKNQWVRFGLAGASTAKPRQNYVTLMVTGQRFVP